MRAPDLVIAACWLIFFGVWAALSIVGGGHRGRRRFTRTGALIRLVLVIAIVFAVQFADELPAGAFGHAASTSAALAGALVCVVGLAFAVWARVTLGRNWGMPMTLHEKPELVTSGPFAYVRHPIYTGIALMFIGSSLAYPIGLAWCVIMIPYFVFSARREERDMEQRFPETYPAYKQRSKMFVPFLL